MSRTALGPVDKGTGTRGEMEFDDGGDGRNIAIDTQPPFSPPPKWLRRKTSGCGCFSFLLVMLVVTAVAIFWFYYR